MPAQPRRRPSSPPSTTEQKFLCGGEPRPVDNAQDVRVRRSGTEFLRVVPEEVDDYIARGWNVVGATGYADRQIAVLLERPARGDDRSAGETAGCGDE